MNLSLLIGCVLLLLTSVPPLQSVYREFRQSVRIRVDQASTSSFDLLSRLVAVPRKRIELFSQIEKIEQENRKVQAALFTTSQELERIRTATLSAHLPQKNERRSRLSFSSGEWIILSGEGDGILSGQTVLLDGNFIGEVKTVFPEYARIETLSNRRSPLAIVHASTRIAGLSRLEAGKFVVTFMQIIEDLHPQDIIASVPDGENTNESYPVGRVQEVSTKPHDSVSQVILTPIAIPKIGDEVTIVGGRR